jgi:hypothetical protein
MLWLSPSPHLGVALDLLVCASGRDTLENLSTCIELLGDNLAQVHKDPSIGWMAAVCAAALRYEAGRVRESGG